ncbi:MAG: autotransporter outer membrane beta-barrel domain-containing protein, partial [Proteobacteria bacterium]|nr:autotransporter outer membrane beta-barrel domain-containing protein [Pseudomonadota bacterium]
DRDGAVGQIDFDADGGGVALGVDARFWQQGMLSLGVAASRTRLDVSDAGGATYESVDVGLSGGWLAGPLRLRGGVHYGRGWHESERQIDFAGIDREAEGRFTSHRVGAGAQAGWAFDALGWEIEPQLGVDYTYLREDAVDESNARGLSLDVERRETQQWASEAGASVAKRFEKTAYWGPWLEWADGIWATELRAHYRRVWTGSERRLVASLEGAPGAGNLRVEGSGPDDGVRAGAGVHFRPRKSYASLRAGYDVFWGDGTLQHHFTGGVEIPF